ncbi:transposase [Hymenobacter bucti]|uniref:Transposase n=1 Tax=Hymenobacter bucti TaxID=1844114 RepID=A0ABW4QZJ7_9BACT
MHAANGHDSRGANPLLPARNQLRPVWASRLRSVLTDRAYQGRFAHYVQALGWQQQLGSRPPTAGRSFVPVTKRWVVERTFAWLNCFRLVVMDYERQPVSHGAWLLVANLTMSLRRTTSS